MCVKTPQKVKDSCDFSQSLRLSHTTIGQTFTTIAHDYYDYSAGKVYDYYTARLRLLHDYSGQVVGIGATCCQLQHHAAGLIGDRLIACLASILRAAALALSCCDGLDSVPGSNLLRCHSLYSAQIDGWELLQCVLWLAGYPILPRRKSSQNGSKAPYRTANKKPCTVSGARL